jgi:hypothetical protein
MKSRRVKKSILLSLMAAVLVASFSSIANPAFAATDTGAGTDDPSQTSGTQPAPLSTNDTADGVLEDSYQEWLAAQKSTLSTRDATVGDFSPATLTQGQTNSFSVDAPADGLYRVQLTYLSTENSLIDPEFSIAVDGGFEFYEARTVPAPTLWTASSAKFVTNANGDDLIPDQKPYGQPNTIIVNDASYDQPNGLLFHFDKGTNDVTLTLTSGTLTLQAVAVLSGEDALPSYAEYQKSLPADAVKKTGDLITLEAESTAYKNTSYAQPQAVNSSDVVPYTPGKRLLNTFGAGSWNTSGQAVTWKFTVKKAGLYTFTVKNEQNNQGKPVFRTIAFDGSVPFSELENYRFDTNTKWTNTTLGNAKGAFRFYFSAGSHTVTMSATEASVSDEIYQLDAISQSVNDLGLQIQKLTGNNSDPNYQWNLAEYIPDVAQQMNGYISSLEKVRSQVTTIYGAANANAQELVQLGLVINQLKDLNKDVNKLPSQLESLFQGSSSVTETIATIETTIEAQPLSVDRFYVSSGADLPSPTAAWWVSLWNGIVSFFESFGSGSSQDSSTGKTITVWVERSQQYVDLMQSLADSSFTSKTGVKVNFEIMPDESKLILASASGDAPDVALGISVGVPYNLALRGAILPLNDLPGFAQTAQQFSPGALVPIMVGKTVYGLPETQDFYVQFTRNDIMGELGISAPKNWDDVLTILPTLQRTGMNYYVPLSGSAGTKAMMFTAPYIFQNGGSLYNADGTQTAITSANSIKGLQFMTDLYTTYSLPLQVNSFYNSFRYGQLPIGISNFQTYVQLTSAAPEIANEWSIQPYPGVVQSDGSVNRSAPGSAQEDMIFKSTKNKADAWSFLQWWLSTSTQTTFANDLQTTYGPQYMWNTANLEAFKQLPWPQADKEAILTQWEQLEEAPQTPAGYMEERQISNIWTNVVINGQDLRAATQNASIIINKEIQSRLGDFGYIQSGKLVKPYVIPSVALVEEVLGEK